MFDGVVHDDVVFAHWQPGTQSDDVTVLQGFWALPLKREEETSASNSKQEQHILNL